MAEIEFLDDVDVDSTEPAPLGQPCDACGCPLDPQDKFCPACGTPHEIEPPITVIDAAIVDEPLVVEAEVVPDEPRPRHAAPSVPGTAAGARPAERPHREQKYFRCDNCGAEVGVEGEQRSFVCPFCDSTYVSEFSPVATGRQEPEFVIGFAITPEQAHQKFRDWIGQKSLFRPGDLKSAKIEDKLRGVYLPFWSFSMLAESRWDASIGEYWYRTETYVTRDSKGKLVTKTRRVRETEWWPLSGRHHRYYSGFLVSGSKGLPQDQAERIKPFRLPALKRYEPMYLAGWMSEEYSIARDEALQRCQQEFYRREGSNIGNFLPGDTHRGLEVSTSFRNVNSDLCLLPIYILSYRYDDKLYRFLVNGQTGKCDGDKPVSWKRIGLTGLGIALLMFLVVAIVLVAING